MVPFFQKIVDALNDLKIPYMLSGSMAMSVYIVPRATRDFDFVVYMQQGHVINFVKQFESNCYVNEEEIKAAIKHHRLFNIIDLQTNYKADFIPMTEDDYGIEAFNRRVEMEYFGRSFFIITAEDLILAKLKWIQHSQSAIQKGDISNLSKLENLDWIYINKWLQKLQLKTFDLVLKND